MKLIVLYFVLLVQVHAWFTSKPKAAEGDIRLVDGNKKTTGRVELYHDGKWGTVCDKNFNINAAKVVCKSLGLGGGTPKWHGFYGQGKGPVWLAEFRCSGKEISLSKCSRANWGGGGCEHSQDAGVECSGDTAASEGDIRLVKGKTKFAGRVEIYHQSQWGTICSNSWSEQEARVVCRQLGYSGVTAEAKLNAHFGKGKGPVYLSGLYCGGEENRLTQCTFHGWTGSSCGHKTDVGVECNPVPNKTPVREASIRLAGTGATRGAGRVEIYHNGEWGTVCNDQFTDKNAGIVCKELGLSPTGAKAVTKVRQYGEGKGPVWLDDVSCFGNESRIDLCPHAGWGEGDCRHDQDVAVQCGGSTAPTPRPASRPSTGKAVVRLVGGRNAMEGRLEVYHDNKWGTVCDDGFTESNAQVVCQQLGYGSALDYRERAYFGEGQDPIWLSDVYCRGRESSLVDCEHSAWGVKHCEHKEDVGVICSNSPVSEVIGQDTSFDRGPKVGASTSGSSALRLVDGVSEQEGRLEMLHDGEWGTVCDDGFDQDAASVSCKQLGFQGGTYKERGYYGYGSGPIWLDETDCDGSERTLQDCGHEDWGDTDCSHGEDVGLLCY